MTANMQPVARLFFSISLVGVSACADPSGRSPCTDAMSTTGLGEATSLGGTSLDVPSETSTGMAPTTMASEDTGAESTSDAETTDAGTTDAETTGSDEGDEPDEPCDGLDNDGDGMIDEGYDLDGDGVARCCQPGPLFVTRGSANTEVVAWMHEGLDACSFAPALHPLADTSVDARPPSPHAVGDFDEDGSLDVIYSRYDDVGEQWDMYIAMCDGEWHSTSMGSMSEPYWGGGDLDADGHVDLLSMDVVHDGGITAAAGYSALGSGMGSFPTILSDSFDPSEVIGAWLARRVYNAADVTQDGTLDYVVVEFASGGASSTIVHLFEGIGDGSFLPSVQVGVVPTQPQNTGDLGDVNGDGHVDWVGGPDDDGDRGSVQVMLGDGLGAFGPPFELVDTCDGCPGSGAGHGGGMTLLFDGDQDGDLDLLTSRTIDTGVSAVIECWDNDGGGVFPSVPEVVVDVPEFPSGWMVTPLRN